MQRWCWESVSAVLPDQQAGVDGREQNTKRVVSCLGRSRVMQICEIMSTRLVTIGPRDAASEAWNRMRRGRIRHLLVMEARRLVGVLSERDLGGRAGAAVRKRRRVQDLMTPNVVSAAPETTLRKAADLMRGRLIGCLPVLDGDRLVGIVTASDIFDALGSVATDTMSRAERQLLQAPSSSKRLGGQPVISRRSRARHKAPHEHPRATGNDASAPRGSPPQSVEAGGRPHGGAAGSCEYSRGRNRTQSGSTGIHTAKPWHKAWKVCDLHRTGQRPTEGCKRSPRGRRSGVPHQSGPERSSERGIPK
jgi:acetoin utilization protein AcuB